MDVLGALVMRYFGHTRCKYQEAEWQFGLFDSREDTIVNGRPNGLGADEEEGHTHLHLASQRRGDTDRMEWGSYTETAPPVLPENTWIPGFEDELLLAHRRHYDELDYYESGEGDSEDEQVNLKDGDREDARRDERDEQTKTLGDAHTTTRRARDPYLPISSRSSTSFLPTILSNILTSFDHGNPSSLFGSTTHPAATSLFDPAWDSNSNRASRTSSLTSTMASKTHLWISLWFLLTAPVIFWDASYCFMRPRSFKGGDLHWIWKLYEIYQEVDLVYGVEAYNRGDGFTNAQSFMNVIETLLNLYYLYAQHILASPTAPIIGLAAAVMTLSKTVLYWAQEYFCGGCAVGHNDFRTLLVFWIIPNGIWLIFPSLVIARLARDVADGLTAAGKIKAVKKE